MWHRLKRWWLGPSPHTWSPWEPVTLIERRGIFHELAFHVRYQQRLCLTCGFTQEQPIAGASVDEHADFSILERP